MEVKPYAPMDIKYKEKVLKQVNKTLQDLENKVKEVKEWLETQNRLPETPSDAMIEFIIVLTEFDVEETKEKLEIYYTIRTELPNVFKNSHPLSENMIETLDFTQIYPLPKLINDEENIALVRLKNAYAPTGFNANYWLAGIINIFEVIMQQSIAPANSVIYDHENLSLVHVCYITPAFIINSIKLIEKLFNNRIKYIHIINHPSIFQIVLTICKPLMKPELYAKIKLHDSVESLAKYVPLNALPKEYGGNEKSLEELEWAWKEKLYDTKDRFDKLENLKIDESLHENSVNKEPEGLLQSFSQLIFN